MMILPLADSLQNCLQNLTSRIAGIDNEQMSNKVFGTGAMLGFGLGAIKEQFKAPEFQNKSSNNSTNNNSRNGLQGIISRAKSFISPVPNLTAEKDYNGNVNPIRNIIPSTKSNLQNTTQKKAETNNNNRKITPKTIVKNMATASLKGTKAYLTLGAKMAEGDFSSYKYKKQTSSSTTKNSIHNTEYLSNIQKGTANEFNDNSKE